MKVNNAMSEWAKYCELFNASADRATLVRAARAMQDRHNKRAALRNLGITTASERKEIAARWESINAVTEREAAAHCQFSGLF